MKSRRFIVTAVSALTIAVMSTSAGHAAPAPLDREAWNAQLNSTHAAFTSLQGRAQKFNLKIDNEGNPVTDYTITQNPNGASITSGVIQNREYQRRCTKLSTCWYRWDGKGKWMKAKPSDRPARIDLELSSFLPEIFDPERTSNHEYDDATGAFSYKANVGTNQERAVSLTYLPNQTLVVNLTIGSVRNILTIYPNVKPVKVAKP